MSDYVRSTRPRVPNPVHPSEDFADKWHDLEYSHLQLEHNFWLWLEQARNDFRVMEQSRDADFIVAQAHAKLGDNPQCSQFEGQTRLGTVNVVTTPKNHTIVGTPTRPWMRA